MRLEPRQFKLNMRPAKKAVFDLGVDPSNTNHTFILTDDGTNNASGVTLYLDGVALSHDTGEESDGTGSLTAIDGFMLANRVSDENRAAGGKWAATTVHTGAKSGTDISNLHTYLNGRF